MALAVISRIYSLANWNSHRFSFTWGVRVWGERWGRSDIAIWKLCWRANLADVQEASDQRSVSAVKCTWCDRVVCLSPLPPPARHVLVFNPQFTWLFGRGLFSFRTAAAVEPKTKAPRWWPRTATICSVLLGIVAIAESHDRHRPSGLSLEFFGSYSAREINRRLPIIFAERESHVCLYCELDSCDPI